MIRTMNSLEYSKAFLKRINGLTINDVPIYDFFIYENYSLWSFFQQLIWEDIKKFLNDRSLFDRRLRWSRFHRLFPSLFVSAVSITALIKFLLKRPQIFVYGVDIVAGDAKVDLRMGKIYKYFTDIGVSYGEILHTNINRRAISNLLQRKRVVLYLEFLNFFYKISKVFKNDIFLKDLDLDDVNLEGFSVSEKKMALSLLKKYSRLAELSVFKIRFLAGIFKLIKPRSIFLIDDARYYHEILLAAKLAGVRTRAFQHSRFNEYLPGWIYYEIPAEKCIVPDKFFVWNEYWRDRLLKISPIFSYYRDRIVIGGKAYLAEKIGFVATLPDDVTTVLIPYEKFGSVYEIKKCIAKILECGKTKILFKLRKDESPEEQLERFDLPPDNSNFEAISDLDENLLKKIDLVIATHSTMLYEMVEAGKAVGVLKTENTQARDLIEDGLATEIDCEEDICLQIKKASDIDKNILLQRSEKLRTDSNLEEALLSERI